MTNFTFLIIASLGLLVLLSGVHSKGGSRGGSSRSSYSSYRSYRGSYYRSGYRSSYYGSTSSSNAGTSTWFITLSILGISVIVVILMVYLIRRCSKTSQDSTNADNNDNKNNADEVLKRPLRDQVDPSVEIYPPDSAVTGSYGGGYSTQPPSAPWGAQEKPPSPSATGGYNIYPSDAQNPVHHHYTEQPAVIGTGYGIYPSDSNPPSGPADNQTAPRVGPPLGSYDIYPNAGDPVGSLPPPPSYAAAT